MLDSRVLSTLDYSKDPRPSGVTEQPYGDAIPNHTTKPSTQLTVESNHRLSIVVHTSDHSSAFLDQQTYKSGLAAVPTYLYTATSIAETSSSLTPTNLANHLSKPLLPLTSESVTEKVSNIHNAALDIGLELPSQTEAEILGDLSRQGRSVMERWIMEQEQEQKKDALHKREVGR